MTNEEAIKVLEAWIECDKKMEYADRLENIEIYNMAIKALEQQPCEDAISREAVKETIFEQGSAEKLEIDFVKLLLLQRAIKALPSVTPKAETGQWLQCSEPWGGMQEWKCSNCKNYYDVSSGYKIIPYNYCPNCGVRMTESEDKG